MDQVKQLLVAAAVQDDLHQQQENDSIGGHLLDHQARDIRVQGDVSVGTGSHVAGASGN